MNNLNRVSGATRRTPLKPILAAKRRRQLYPFFFSMGPVPLAIISVLLIGLMAVLYLTQLGQAVSANQRIQEMRAEQAVLQRQNQDLVNTIASEQSPGYIATQAKSSDWRRAGRKKCKSLWLRILSLSPTLTSIFNHDPTANQQRETGRCMIN